MAPKRKRESVGPNLSRKLSTASLNSKSNSQDLDSLADTYPSSNARNPLPKNERIKEALQDDNFIPEVVENPGQVNVAAARPPPVNSDYLPLPWKGRLGYACLNTYLRSSNPPVFSSRTCRIASIEEHNHPLNNPNELEHPTKNRPDKNKPKDPELGKRWVENLGLANARDIIKMVRWNDRYGIKFMRLSSEMFPFASHPKYGYTLAPFAAETLAQAGKVISELGHRVSVHPGQFTQLGSPRQEVIENSIRDLEYHDEMLTLLKLSEQQDKDAVMILHMGGMFGSKSETLDRFRSNYAKLSLSIKRRLVLENDDMCWSVHDLLPICQELNIPLCLDFHHSNIVFDSSKIREGTKDIMRYFPEIRETWTRKGITQKMHLSESVPGAITPMQRRKHSNRVANLPPCAPDMDLMIEAKHKEQAVFELMRLFKLPGYDKINCILPYTRTDENAKPTYKKGASEPEELIPPEEVGMGGPEGRVYWNPEMEEWLRPKKREPKSDNGGATKTKTTTKAKKSRIQQVAEDVPVQIKTSTIGKPSKHQKNIIVPTLKTSDNKVKGVTTRRRSKRASRVSYKEEELSE